MAIESAVRYHCISRPLRTRYERHDLELQTLGATEVRRADGEYVPLEPKRLALLIYLAVGHAGNSVSRDTLLTLFWPEHGEQAARSALRQGLHYLSRRLGAELIIGRGTHEIGVDPQRLRCDVLLFDIALDMNEPARAMKLVRGQFLPGFLYARASSAFLEWVDRERSRLKERSLETALILALEEERRGNTTGELHWLKRALDLEPFREDILEQIVDLYERGGNPATAAQAIRGFSRTLRTRYGTSVSPALRHRLRALQGELVVKTEPEDANQRMQALQQRVSAEMSRTTELMRQLQALTRPGRRSVD